MFERFSDQARQAVELATDESRHLEHPHVGTEHLLLGILAEGSGRAATSLTAAGASLHGCRELAAEAVGDIGRRAKTAADPELTERAQRVLDRASRMALRQHSPNVETDHILAALLDVEGRAGQVLRGLGIDPGRVRRNLDGATEAEKATSPDVATDIPPVQAPTQAEPECANCGAPLESSLSRRRIVPIDPDVGSPAAVMIIYCGRCGSAIGVAPK